MKTTYKAVIVVDLEDNDNDNLEDIPYKLSYTKQAELIQAGNYTLEFIMPLYGAPTIIIKLHE